MTTPMPTIFDVKAQAEEGDYFEPTAADYFCEEEELTPENAPKEFCSNCGVWLDSAEFERGICNECVTTTADYPACPICGDPIDYCLGHADQCRECGRDLAPDSVSYHCDSCDNELYFEAAMMDRFDAKFGI